MDINKIYRFISVNICNIKHKLGKISYFTIVKYLFLISILLFLTFPFYVMVITSLKSHKDIVENNLLSWPKQGLQFINYKNVFALKDFKFLKYFTNTCIMVSFSTLSGIVCCVLAAFALSFFVFPLKRIILMLLFLAMSITSETLILTNFRTVSNLGLVDNGNGSVIPGGVYFAMTFPYLINVVHLFLLIQTFKRVPKELYYTAKVDGVNNLQYLWKILLPITKPTVIVIAVFRTIAAWNAYAWPELVGAKLLTNMIRKIFDSESVTDTLNLQMAIFVLINLPLLFLFIIFKKYIISGDSRRGIKG
ncbi:carbohydrate ABC transporter permease [Candidatus Phytoplasma citri]|uniref:Carbohydrate ABC transporter permease n=1 Tax=Candidatus Phytoplasma citri TaxID=180978 RepID=A0ABU8ZRL6_9MOLU|nr:carbohydrate ABC transporter permease [Candidatus Phytoplasma aurantifolia]MDO8060100.1 carbohydrate ABC transporter permease [Candidatus Phytoplasma aurantifolia]MDO8078778.1 carbohydrate ABC transporter permease [Candidatus Phytoplasma aurantifolia]